MLPQSALLPPLGHRKTIPLAIFENWRTAEKWQHDCQTKQLFDLTTTITDSWGCAWQQSWWSLKICQIRMFTSFMIFLQVYHVIFNVLHSIVENSITEVSLHYIIIDWGCLCLWQSERNQKYGWRYISWYNEAMYSTAWTFNDVKITLIWSLTSISSLRYLMSAHESIVLELKC